ncbi:MAG: N-acetylmuramoyl-L-alanine amidase [Gemmatimonadetes bacterium]|nr:N-acetylmuramoyl-L-alanine amidase [Gemmatimonadota bacterium]
MIGLLAVLSLGTGMHPVREPARMAAPASVVIATSRGESVVPVSEESGVPALPAPYLSRALPLSAEVKSDWALVTFAGQPFRFLLEAPVFLHGNRLVPLAGGAFVARDTLFLPLQWLTDYVPSVFAEGYRYDALAGRFEELRITPVITRPRPVARSPRLLPSGVLRFPHTVVVDAGHGGEDPGNPGLYFPGFMREKDVNLGIAKLLRIELQKRGIEVVMTRTRDTLIALGDRGRYCRADCDLFLSIHVNSLPRRSGYQNVSGIETYFLAAARTADEQRVANMENEALRYDADRGSGSDDALQFILKDLQTNEYLRESAVLASLIQDHAGRRHPGGDRGVSQAGFVVLTTARRPAVLVETGFSTNPTDGRYLASPAGQLHIAQSLADGVVAYLRQYENKVASEAEP